MQTVSKSQLKPHLLEFLRVVEKGKKPVIITHLGKPVAKIMPYKEDADDILFSLRESVIAFENPTKPAAEEKEWEALQ